jgi:hydroxysqualene dehydroxylase
MLGANPALFQFLQTVGAGDGLFTPAEASFPFVDLGTGTAWRLRPNRGRIPWWLLLASRRVPETGLGDYLAIWRLFAAGPERTVGEVLPAGSLLFRRLWEPLSVAVLNAAPGEGAARLLARVVADTFLTGGASACRPYMARHGLSEALVEPALRWLEQRGASLTTGSRVRALEGEPSLGQVSGLVLAGERVAVEPGDHVILAVPPQVAGRLVPGLAVPEESRAIVNVHYLLPASLAPPAEAVTFAGIVGGTAQWLFRRGDVASVTVSAAYTLADEAEAAISTLIWPDVAGTIRLLDPAAAPPEAAPPARVIKEKRATFLQSPANERRRPGPRVAMGNLFLAGDWTDTGLPATIEGAVRSGVAAARTLLESLTGP